MSATRRRPDTSNPSDGSRTITVHDSAPREEDSGPGAGPSNSEPIGSLHLRGGEGSGRRVMWTDDTVDNEGAGRKKSKICCIYRKPRAFDESSSEESSSDEDSGPEDDGSARPANRNGNGRRHARSHRHHLHQHGEDGTCPADGLPSVNELEDKPEPNAYERAPGKGKGKAD